MTNSTISELKRIESNAMNNNIMGIAFAIRDLEKVKIELKSSFCGGLFKSKEKKKYVKIRERIDALILDLGNEEWDVNTIRQNITELNMLMNTPECDLLAKYMDGNLKITQYTQDVGGWLQMEAYDKVTDNYVVLDVMSEYIYTTVYQVDGTGRTNERKIETAHKMSFDQRYVECIFKKEIMNLLFRYLDDALF